MCPGRADDGVPLTEALGEYEGAAPLVPEEILAPEPAGPGVLEDRQELDVDVEIHHRVYFEKDQDPRKVLGGQNMLTDRESFMIVVHDHMTRRHFHPGRHPASRDRLRVLRDGETQPDVSGHLQGMCPDLSLTCLESQPGGFGSHNTQVFARPGRALQEEWEKGSDIDPGHADFRYVGKVRIGLGMGRAEPAWTGGLD